MNPENFKVLIKNISLHKLDNVIPYNVAAYNVNKKLKLYFGMDSRGGTVTSDRQCGFIEIDAVPVDEILQKLSLFPDWIKIDVEGAEYEVLSGLVTALKNNKPKLIVEVTHDNERKILDFMNSCGYKSEQIFLPALSL